MFFLPFLSLSFPFDSFHARNVLFAKKDLSCKKSILPLTSTYFLDSDTFCLSVPNSDGVQVDIDALAKESSEKEHQWSATKEVYHREFGAIVDDTSKPVTVVKGSLWLILYFFFLLIANFTFGPFYSLLVICLSPLKKIAKAELDIKKLQDQIASLQKQLDAVSLKRKEMVADAAEQHRRLVERNGGGIDDE